MRSSLAELEMQASQALRQMESLKVTTNASTSQSTAQPQPRIIPQPTTGLLSSDRYAPTDILSLLESVIVSNAADPDEADELDESANYIMPPLNEVSHLALISHSIIAYLSHLDYRKLTRITSKISGDTNRWLAHLFHFIEAKASYHNDSTEAILRAIR